MRSTNWPQFRGPHANGQVDMHNLPLTWNESTNVVWKTPVHDRGWSSPVVWEDQVWLTTATRDGKKLYAICVNKETGKVVHDVHVFDVEKPQRIANENSYATPHIGCRRVKCIRPFWNLWNGLPGSEFGAENLGTA